MKTPLNKQQKKELKIIRKSSLFDAKWYLDTYEDVAKAGINPVNHYAFFGWKEGRNPSPYFNTNAYLEKYKDVAAAKKNPLIHYEMYGRAEGRAADGITDSNSLKKYQFSWSQKIIFHLERWWGNLRYKKAISRNKDARILVCLHLFYLDSWSLISTYLNNLGKYKYDLVVSYVEGMHNEEKLADTINAIRAFKKDTKILAYPNMGFDVGSFLDILRNVKLEDYDIIFKLHSKGINRKFIYIYNQIFKYQDWFFNLFNGVLSGINVHKTIDKLMQDPRIGLVAAENLIVHDPLHKQHFTNKIAEKLNIDILENYKYVAGTCFGIKAHLLKPIQALNLSIQSFEKTERGVFSLAHGMERLICACIEPAGCVLDGNATRHKKYKSEVRECAKVSAIRLLTDSRFKLDYDFFYKVLEMRRIKTYKLENIRLGDIRREWEGKLLKLSECHPYRYLLGEIDTYQEYVDSNKNATGFDMSINRFESLRSAIQQDFDSKSVPVLNSNNILLDGQHRCCIMLHEKGEDYMIPCIKLYY